MIAEFINVEQPRDRKIQHLLNFFDRCEDLQSYNSLECTSNQKRLIRLFVMKLRNNPSDFVILQARELKKELSSNLALLFGM